MLYDSPLLSREHGKVTFTHQLFREFFAARALAKKADLNDSASFARYVADPWWHYTIVLLVGLLPDASPVLYNIVYEGTNYDLGMRCLQESTRLDPYVVQDIVKWLREGHRFTELLGLGSLIRSLSEETKEWQVAESDAILRTSLGSRDIWGGYFAVMGRAFQSTGWPVSEEMVCHVLDAGLQSSNETERGNALFSLPPEQRDVKILEFRMDPSPYVRERVARSIGLVDASKDIDDLLPALTALGQDPDVAVRCTAMEAACAFAEKGGMDILERGLKDSDARVRLEALQVLVDAEGDWVPEAQAKAIVLLDDLLHRVLWTWDYPEELEQNPTDQILDALEGIDTPESTEWVYVALRMALVDASWVAGVLADRGDIRCLRAVVEEMLETPESYYSDLEWRMSIEQKIVSLVDHPFELAWLEDLLLEDQVLQELDFHMSGRYWPWRDLRVGPHSALDEIVKVCSSSKSALRLFLWLLLLAWIDCVGRSRNTALLEGAVLRLVEINPAVLVELMVSGSDVFNFEGLTNEVPEREFAGRVLKTASTLLAALPDETKEDLWSVADSAELT
jgi:hypothetical protein